MGFIFVLFTLVMVSRKMVSERVGAVRNSTRVILLCAHTTPNTLYERA